MKYDHKRILSYYTQIICVRDLVKWTPDPNDTPYTRKFSENRTKIKGDFKGFKDSCV